MATIIAYELSNRDGRGPTIRVFAAEGGAALRYWAMQERIPKRWVREGDHFNLWGGSALRMLRRDDVVGVLREKGAVMFAAMRVAGKKAGDPGD